MNENTIFINTNLKTHLVLAVSGTDTVADLKRKIIHEHPICFPDLGSIQISAAKIKAGECFYHLTDGMLVKSAFVRVECRWYLYVDVSQDGHVAGASVTNQICNGTMNRLCLTSDLGPDASNRNILKELEMEVKHGSGDLCKTSSCTSSEKMDTEIQEKCQNGVSDSHCHILCKDSVDVVDLKEKSKAKRKFEDVVDTSGLKVNNVPLNECEIQAAPIDERLTENEIDAQPVRQKKKRKIEKINKYSLTEQEALVGNTDLQAVDLASVEGFGQESSKEQPQNLHSENYINKAVVQGQSELQDMGAVDTTLGSTMDDKQGSKIVVQDNVSTVHTNDDADNGPIGEKKKKKRKKEKKMELSSVNNNAPAADPTLMVEIRQESSREQPNTKDLDEKNGVEVVQVQVEPSLNSHGMGSAGDILMHEVDTSEMQAQNSGKETESARDIDGKVIPREISEPVNKSATEVILSEVLVNDEAVEAVKSRDRVKRPKKNKKKGGKEDALPVEQANNSVLAPETMITEEADVEIASTIDLDTSEKVLKVVDNVDDSVQPMQGEKVEEMPVLRAAKGIKKSRKKSKHYDENLSEVQMKDNDAGKLTLPADKTKEIDKTENVNTSKLAEPERVQKVHEDVNDSVQPKQTEGTEETLVVPVVKEKKKSKKKKKSKHTVEENLSDNQTKNQDVVFSTPSIEKTKEGSEKGTNYSRQQLNHEVTGSAEAFDDNVIDGKRSEGGIKPIRSSEKVDPHRTNDNHDSETESKVGNSNLSITADKLVPKTPLSFHDAFSKRKEAAQDKSRKKSDTGKTLLAIMDNISRDGDGVNSDDDGTVDSDATKAPSDYFSSSDDSDTGSYILKRKGGDENSTDLMTMDLDAVLKSSVRYKKAKIVASQGGQYDEPVESVPDTQL